MSVCICFALYIRRFILRVSKNYCVSFVHSKYFALPVTELCVLITSNTHYGYCGLSILLNRFCLPLDENMATWLARIQTAILDQRTTCFAEGYDGEGGTCTRRYIESPQSLGNSLEIFISLPLIKVLIDSQTRTPHYSSLILSTRNALYLATVSELSSLDNKCQRRANSRRCSKNPSVQELLETKRRNSASHNHTYRRSDSQEPTFPVSLATDLSASQRLSQSLDFIATTSFGSSIITTAESAIPGPTGSNADGKRSLSTHQATEMTQHPGSVPPSTKSTSNIDTTPAPSTAPESEVESMSSTPSRIPRKASKEKWNKKPMPSVLANEELPKRKLRNELVRTRTHARVVPPSSILLCLFVL